MKNDHLGLEHEDHPIRALVPMDHNLTDLECENLCNKGLSAQDYEDWETIGSDYNWPENFSFYRQLLALYTSASEYQLLRYCEGNMLHVADKKMHAVWRLL